MSFELWNHWLLLRPLTLLLFACLLLVLAVLLGWYAQRYHAKRTREAEAEWVATVVEDAANRSDEVTASEELARPRAGAGWPGEWDGGQPRPNCGLLVLDQQVIDSLRRSSLDQPRPNCGLLALGQQADDSLRRSSLGQPRPNFGLLALGQQMDDSLSRSLLSQQPAAPVSGRQSRLERSNP